MRLRFLLHLLLSIGWVGALVPMARAAAPHLENKMVATTATTPATTPTTAPTVDDDAIDEPEPEEPEEEADEPEEEPTDAGTK